jgi:RNA polymerase sigma factor (sigma-70 family)
MATGPIGKVLQHLRHRAGAEGTAALSDRQLLERFLAQQEDAAFAALVQRHGPLVLGVCRRVLHNEHDAEDVFQATFLVLVRKAEAIRKQESVGSWLHGVAYRIALKAKCHAARCQALERQAALPDVAPPDNTVAWQDLRPLLDEELDRLPEKYRAPLVLCYFEGKTYDEAARQLGWKNGTLCGRLARARDLLRTRLVRRGLVLSAAVGAMNLGQGALTAAVPAPLVASTCKAALLFAAGEAAAGGLVSANVAALTKGVLKTMFLTKLKIATAIVLAVGLASTSAGVLTYGKLGAAQPRGPHSNRLTAAMRFEDDKKKDEAKKDDEQNTEEEDIKQSETNLKQIALAMINYNDNKGNLPASALFDKDGKALLSWRVLILPYLGEEELYKEFHLDEAWDSEHNKKLLAKMPKIYAPVRGHKKDKDSTVYQVFTGKNTPFDGQAVTKFPVGFPDGTSNTILIIEAAKAVPWTKPADLEFDLDKDLPKLGGMFEKGFQAALADGSVLFIRKDFDEFSMKLAIMPADGQVIDFRKLKLGN